LSEGKKKQYLARIDYGVANLFLLFLLGRAIRCAFMGLASIGACVPR
jgi:hypothetical protein